jgi:hypothetical protein
VYFFAQRVGDELDALERQARREFARHGEQIVSRVGQDASPNFNGLRCWDQGPGLNFVLAFDALGLRAGETLPLVSLAARFSPSDAPLDYSRRIE